MMYYPKNKIQTNLFTNGDKYQPLESDILGADNSYTGYGYIVKCWIDGNIFGIISWKYVSDVWFITPMFDKKTYAISLFIAKQGLQYA